MRHPMHWRMGVLAAAFALGTLGMSARPAATLADRVGHELNMLPYYGVFDSINYQVDGGTVTLTGAVHYPVIAEDAVRAVKGIEGVAEVKNSIEVLPLSPFDDQIRLAAWRQMISWPSLSFIAAEPHPSVRILVKNGHITLAGVVPRQADKDALTIRLNSLPNVFSVTNDLVVENPQPHKG